MICQGALSPAQLLITSTDPLGNTVCKQPDPQKGSWTLEDVFMLTSKELGFTPRLPNSTNLTSHLLHGPRPSLLPSHIPLQHLHLLSFRSEPSHQMIQSLNYRPEVPQRLKTQTRGSNAYQHQSKGYKNSGSWFLKIHPFHKVTQRTAWAPGFRQIRS